MLDNPRPLERRLGVGDNGRHGIARVIDILEILFTWRA